MVDVAIPARTRPRRIRRIGSVGRLASWKGQDHLLRALAPVLRDDPELSLSLIGDTIRGPAEYRQYLQNLAVELGILHRQLEFRGHCTDMAQEYEKLDLLVHCSTTPEPLGQVLLEAMSIGIPVVAPAEGGPATFIEDGYSGLLYTPRDDDSLRSVVESLLTDPHLADSLISGGRQAAQSADPARVMTMLADVWREVGR